MLVMRIILLLAAVSLLDTYIINQYWLLFIYRLLSFLHHSYRDSLSHHPVWDFNLRPPREISKPRLFLKNVPGRFLPFFFFTVDRIYVKYILKYTLDSFHHRATTTVPRRRFFGVVAATWTFLLWATPRRARFMIASKLCRCWRGRGTRAPAWRSCSKASDRHPQKLTMPRPTVCLPRTRPSQVGLGCPRG